MLKIFLNTVASLALVAGSSTFSLAERLSTDPMLIPAPTTLQILDGSYVLSDDIAVSVAPEFLQGIEAVRLLLGPSTGFKFSTATPDRAGVRISYEAGLHAEGYRLRVDDNGIDITAASDAGAFFALQTLRQLLPPEIYSSNVTDLNWEIPAIYIEDEPRLSWRGLHLDVGRHFMPVAFVKKYIDLLAVHKMNRFHWHLTEDQGWRIEIKRYPKLTSVGSVRAQTVVGNAMFANKDEKVFDNTPHGGFYTQKEVKEVVAYAAARHVMVVPEIEFPGHAQAAIAAYPELGNTGKQFKVREDWGISKNTIKPSDETLEFYRNVLTEVMALFPSPFIHIGGDEAPKDQWEESPYAQQRIAELGLANAHELQSWLIQQIDDFLNENGRRLIGWDEIMQGGLSSNATVMSWRGMKPGLRAAEAGHDVIMAPTRWTYFDYYQADSASEPMALGSYVPLREVYAFEPAPAELPADIRQRILGAQGQLWTEFMKTSDQVEYMAYPRAVALSEVVWSPRDQRDYKNFLERLSVHLARLDTLEVNYRPLGNDELDFWENIKQSLLKNAMDLYFWYSDL
ncbi:MAG: beta-N-acetylhexosaminidase [Halioglobus sp.]